MLARRLLLLLSFFLLSVLRGQVPGKRHFGTKAYIEYVEGNLPIILAAPHGGRRIPATIPKRKYGVLIRDRRTQALAREIARELFLLTGRHAHLVVSHLDRSRLDPNRGITEAAQGNKEAEQAWREFHSFLTQARGTVTRQWKRGLFLDIHGHGHKIQRVELGYLLSSTDLRKSDSSLRQGGYRDRSSIRSLASLPGKDFPSLLRGKDSLGGLLQARSIRGVPSPSDPNPGSNPYFRGGYNTRRHGSRDGGTVDAIQLEHPWSIRKTRDTRNPYAKKLASALLSLMNKHYGMDLRGGTRVQLKADAFLLAETGGKVRVRLVRAMKANSPLSLPLLVEGTALPGKDYSLPPKTLTIPAGQTETAFELRAIPDQLQEGPETIILRLQGGPEVVGSNQLQLQIQDQAQAQKEQAHWSFEQVHGGSLVFDDSGSARDLHLQPSGQPPSLVAGAPMGLALLLDGKSQHALARLPGPGKSFHLGLSFLLSGPPKSESFLLCWGSLGKPNSLALRLLPGSGYLRNELRFANDEVAGDALDVETNLADGKWHRLDLQSEGSGWVQVWIDRRLERSMVLGGTQFSPTGPLFLGSSSNLSSSSFFAGALDEVHLGPPLPTPAFQAWSPRAHAGPMGQPCLGSSTTPLLRPWGLPAPSSPFGLKLLGAGARTPGLLLLGLSDRSWNGLPLPFDLSSFGIAGCKLWVSGEVLLAQTSDPNGEVLHRLFLPGGPRSLGLLFYSQALLLIPRGRGLSLGASNALRLRVGI
ncbi:MAG TPA: hypothetical protein ENK02_15320 [Planctomycetes bacterium]|nr:hypothetical protein [Planctomycetota bacterium]